MKLNTKFLLVVLLLVQFVLLGCSDIKSLNTPRQEQVQISGNNTGEKVLLDAPIISQMPEYRNGCEVTSLTMLLQYAGVQVDKKTLAEKLRKDETPLVMNENGNIISWGDPNDGFVGDITGKKKGFAVYPGPLIELMEQYLPGRAVNLTKQPFENLLKSIDNQRPVIVWITADFNLPDRFEEWQKDGKKIRVAFDEHAVLLVGYDKNNCYINNPYNGMKNQEVNRETFKKIWNAMGSMAVSYK